MRTIIDVIERQIEAGRPGARFTLFNAAAEPRERSIREIRTNALGIAGRLKKGERVVIALPKGFEFIDVFFGCLYAGAIAVPVAMPTKGRGSDALANVIADCGATVCVTDARTREGFAPMPGVDVLTSEELAVDEMSAEPDRDGEIALIQYTSGSTGQPKGVVVTHENLLANSAIIRDLFQNTEESTSVSWLPHFHDMGLVDGIIQPVFAGFHSVMMTPMQFLRRPASWLRAMSEFKATYSGGPNFAFDLLIDRVRDEDVGSLDLTHLQYLYNGSERVRASTLERFVDKFAKAGFSAEKFVTCYGLGEATLAVSAKKGPAALCGSAVSCGGVLGDTSIRIVDPYIRTEKPEGEVGEIWLSGKSVSPGYYGRDDLTEETFVEHDGAHFLRTGDLGFLSDDELFVTGRLKEVVVINGTNHCPHDIEATVAQSHHALHTDGCAAFSVEVDRQERLVVIGEVKRPFVETDPQHILSSIMSELSAKAGIAPYDVVLIHPNTLPKTTSGKIARNKCRTLWETQTLTPLAFLNKGTPFTA